MNRRRPDRRCGALPVAVLITTAALAACGGIIKVCYKNRQIEVNRRIAHVEDQIARHRDDIRTLRRQTDELMNCFAMGEDLDINDSELRPIPAEAIEHVGSRVSAAGVAMAENRP
jgi:hypothetical protein